MKFIILTLSMLVFTQVYAGASLKMEGKIQSISKKEIVMNTRTTRVVIDRSQLFGENSKIKSKGQQVALWVPMTAIKKTEWLVHPKKMNR